jgi:hypothetical protein
MIYFDFAARTVWSNKASNIVGHYRKIGLAVLIGAAVWISFNTLGLPSTLAAELDAGMSSFTIVWVILMVYVLLLAMPFVPSAEIGLALMLALGSSMAVPVYVATILGLTLAFAAGRYAFQFQRHNGKGAAQQASDVIAVLDKRFQDRPVLRHVLRFRGLAVIALINMPGNTVLGGGGGIAMAIGYTRALTPPAFVLCVAVAVAPVPALFLIANVVGLEGWMHAWLPSFS